VAARGALGISSRTLAERGKERRTATRAPPAETLRAVANSRNSLPLSSRLRTKTGMASGKRIHWRRSFSGLRLVTPAPWHVIAYGLPHLRGQTACQRRLPQAKKPGPAPVIPSNIATAAKFSCIGRAPQCLVKDQKFGLYLRSAAMFFSYSTISFHFPLTGRNP
jgi:hypothetical protein